MLKKELIANILEYIHNNFKYKITITDLANLFNYNNSYIMRLFKKEMGISIIDYINKLKIYKSFTLLLNTDDSILKIALNSGFSSLEYYSETFKKVTGFKSKQFKKIIKEKNQQIEIIIKKMLELKELEEKGIFYIKSVKYKDVPKVKKL